jgi:lysophospholipase L1-like esterase
MLDRFGPLMAAIVVCALLFSACGSDDDAEILVIGDSILAWNAEEQASIGDVIGQTLEREVLIAAVPGARFANPDELAARQGLDIRRQYDLVDRPPVDWVVLDGGGNDLGESCECGECSAQLDELISADGTSGTMVDFVSEVAAAGSNVMFVGYYDVPPDAWFGFNQCNDVLGEQDRRLDAMAQSIDGVWFVDASEVVTADNAAAYAEDRLHPSIEGSRLVGLLVADAIVEAE